MKSKQRVADYGEVFTPSWMVEAMLDVVKDETERIDSRFLEPACGSGNFLVRILQRKLAAVELKFGKSDFERRHYALLALMCTYGIELLEDNIAECRANMLEIIADYLKLEESDELYRAASYVLSQNLVHGDALKMRTSDDQPITFAEWGYLGKGKFQRRDFRLHDLAMCDMQFDVIIGNPPYQLGQSGGEAIGSFAMPIYHKFIEAAKGIEPRYLAMVTPSRWFAGGRGLDGFRQEMLADRRLRCLVDYPDSRDVFPSVDIAGGISYFLWDSSWKEKCKVTTISGGVVGTTLSRYLDEYDILVRYNEAVSILERVLGTSSGGAFDSLASQVAPIQPFSIRTNFRGASRSDGMASPVLVYQNGGTGYIERDEVPRNADWVDQWKVFLSATSSEHGGQADKNGTRRVFSLILIGGPGTACTETYLVAGRFNTEAEAKNFGAYLRTKFVRFLVSLRTNTQHLYSGRFAFVPRLSMDREWTDKKLYRKYGLTEDEIAFIEKVIRSMDKGDE